MNPLAVALVISTTVIQVDISIPIKVVVTLLQEYYWPGVPGLGYCLYRNILSFNLA